MVTRPAHWNPFEFVAVASLRALQLRAGCTPRLDGEHNATTMAQMEVAAGRIGRAPAAAGSRDLVQQIPPLEESPT
jgi:DNA-directed RNA polymerase subunit K/omega